MKTKFRVCIVGCGVISGNHIPSLQRLDEVEIVALCDINTQKAEARKEQFGLSSLVYSDYLTMLDEVKPDAVHILTPHYLHTEMTLAALERGVNVLLEKPTCIKAEDIETLIRAEKNSTARVCVSFQTRYNETVEKAKAIVEADGGATYGFGTIVWNRSDEYYASGDWRGKWATEGGGALINQAIHTIDLLCMFLGQPDKVQAHVSTMRHSAAVEVEDTCSAIIDFKNGKKANILVTTTFGGQDSTTLHIETKNNVIEIRNADIYVNSEKLKTAEISEYMGKKCYGNSHGILIEKFYQALRNGEDMPISLESSASAVQIILGAYKSDSKIINI